MSRRWRGGHASAVAAPRRDNLICAPVSAILSSPSRSLTTRPRYHLASPAQYTSTQRCNAPSRGFSAGGARSKHAAGSLSGSVSPFFQVTRQAPAWKSNVGHPTLSTRRRLGSRVRSRAWSFQAIDGVAVLDGVAVDFHPGRRRPPAPPACIRTSRRRPPGGRIARTRSRRAAARRGRSAERARATPGTRAPGRRPAAPYYDGTTRGPLGPPCVFQKATLPPDDRRRAASKRAPRALVQFLFARLASELALATY